MQRGLNNYVLPIKWSSVDFNFFTELQIAIFFFFFKILYILCTERSFVW